jgi:hypothetical protein
MKQVIVTGASRGLGKAIAARFAELGYHVGLVAKNEERLWLVKEEFDQKYNQKYKGKTTVFACDFEDENALEVLTQELINEFDSLDVLVNNAGLFEMGDYEVASINKLKRLMQVNVYAPYQITKAFFNQLKQDQKGHVFMIGSIVSKAPKPMVFNYSISKNALHSYTQMLREELINSKVKVTEIIPGSVNTSSWDGEEVPREDFIQTEDIVKSIINSINFGASSNVEEIVVRPMNRDF